VREETGAKEIWLAHALHDRVLYLLIWMTRSTTAMREKLPIERLVCIHFVSDISVLGSLCGLGRSTTSLILTDLLLELLSGLLIPKCVLQAKLLFQLYDKVFFAHQVHAIFDSLDEERVKLSSVVEAIHVEDGTDQAVAFCDKSHDFPTPFGLNFFIVDASKRI
jgi:hypothetical protein